MSDPTTDSELSTYSALQRRLVDIWRSLESADPAPHTSVVVPALSFDPEELAKIPGVSFYEERLLFSLIRLRDPGATVVYVTSQPIHPEIIDYYLGLLRGVSVRSARSRLHLLCLHDASPISLTRKILDRPRVVRRIAELIRSPERAYLTCFNSTELERRLALELGIPLNGADVEVLWTGTKSGSRRIFDEAEVEQTPGVADVHSRRDVLDALAELKAGQPGLARAVLKLNESFAGAGNAVLSYDPSGASDPASLERALAALAFTSSSEELGNYLEKMERMGGVVEAFVENDDLRSPSAQLRINPDGSISMISTHDQILGGPTGQTYLGCRFPADEAYRGEIARAAMRVAKVLQRYGVVSRFGVDFLALRSPGGDWRCLGVEINLRMGGTTPPFLALQFLTGGRLDEPSGLFRTARGAHKFYYATDNLRSPSYRGLLPEDFSDILAAHDLAFDTSRETGAVFHMIGALSQFGKLGVTCIGDTPEEAHAVYHRVVEILDEEGADVEGDDDRGRHPFDTTIRGME